MYSFYSFVPIKAVHKLKICTAFIVVCGIVSLDIKLYPSVALAALIKQRTTRLKVEGRLLHTWGELV